MYLSRLTLHPRSREARRDAASPYDLHRTLARAFPTPDGTPYREHHDVLFRREEASRAVGLSVLVQSRTAPDWHELPEAYLLGAETRPFEPSFAVGQSLTFRLVANPIKKVRREGHKHSQKVPLPDRHPVAEQKSGVPFDPLAAPPLTPARRWLARKGEQHGFEVLFVTTRDFQLGVAGRDLASKAALPLIGLRFDGLLRVHDPVRLVEAVRTGVGPSKAFGFGLLSLARHATSRP